MPNRTHSVNARWQSCSFFIHSSTSGEDVSLVEEVRTSLRIPACANSWLTCSTSDLSAEKNSIFITATHRTSALVWLCAIRSVTDNRIRVFPGAGRGNQTRRPEAEARKKSKSEIRNVSFILEKWTQMW